MYNNFAEKNKQLEHIPHRVQNDLYATYVQERQFDIY